MRQRIAKIRRFVKERGYSQSKVAMEVFGGDISRSYISKILNNRTDGLSDDTLDDLVSRMEIWVDSHLESEHILYAKLYSELEGYDVSVQRAVLRQLGRDI